MDRQVISSLEARLGFGVWNAYGMTDCANPIPYVIRRVCLLVSPTVSQGSYLR